MANQSKKQTPGWWIFGGLIAIGLAGYFLPAVLGDVAVQDVGDQKYVHEGWGLVLTWVIVMGLMLVTLVAIGQALAKGNLGILIDPARNMMSLSRLQVVLWTWLVLSAFLTVTLARLADSVSNPSGYICDPPQASEEGELPPGECADPLGVQLPPLLWALMGISVTSAVGSTLLKTNKTQRTEEMDALASEKTSGRQATFTFALQKRVKHLPEAERPTNQGATVKKKSWEQAMFSDIFMGEEVATFQYVDIAKVQNYFFTMVAFVGYFVALWVEMVRAGSFDQMVAFPDLPAGLMAVISISHAGYLTSKSFTQSSQEEED